MTPREVYSRKGNPYGTSGIEVTIPGIEPQKYLVFSLIKPSRKLTEKIYSAARKQIKISSHRDLLKYRDLLATLVSSHLHVHKDQALQPTNLAEYCIRKKLPFLPYELYGEFLCAASQWGEIEQGFKLKGPMTILFSNVANVIDKPLVDPEKGVLGYVDGISQAKNGTILLSVLVKIPTGDTFHNLLRAWVAKKNPEKKISKRLKVSRKAALTWPNIMRYRIVNGHFRNLESFNHFREEVFQPTMVPFKGVSRIEEKCVVYGTITNETLLSSDTRPSGDIAVESSEGEVFYSFEEALDADS
ncbi:MAG: hypothetical protein ACE5R6_07340 [Candidatus Heimdallarchaeota archaeon]